MEAVVTIVAGMLLLVGALGVIFPVLPGSILVIVGLLVWAIGIGGPVGWVVFGIGAACALAGMSASWLLTGKRLKERQIPNRTILVATVVGVIGAFVIPVVGLIIGFIAGLYACEWLRLRDAGAAWESSLVALKSTGIGMLIEFGCAGLAITVWVIGVFVHF
ncbi:DUF456 domain-containing protein [Brooklawnia cerclae]|uniref:DUF456 domain-containing protein n=1 Tax=Brooklawnia cerclae TaxID=349934 RepID=A0ABX0SHL6_9ACTN|nr:hypothetical protein [Brooklawnia cerclae]